MKKHYIMQPQDFLFLLKIISILDSNWHNNDIANALQINPFCPFHPTFALACDYQRFKKSLFLPAPKLRQINFIYLNPNENKYCNASDQARQNSLF